MFTHEPEAKTVTQAPNVNFVWFGTFRGDSFDGAKLLSQAKNSEGQSYPVTYWVDADQVDAARKKLEEDHVSNIQVKSIQEAIKHYCAADSTKIAQINALLEMCRKEDLPTVQKEILAPIIQSQTSGYFFDTSIGIGAGESVNLRMLERPALARNLIYTGDDGTGKPLKYKPIGNVDRLTTTFNSSVDLYVYFSDVDAFGNVSPASRTLFTKLADDTISTWQEFFTKKMEYKPPEKDSSGPSQGVEKFVSSKMLEMINDTLMGPVARIYKPQTANDNKDIIFLFDKKTNVLQMSMDMGVIFPDIRQDRLGFTTIDGVFEREEKDGRQPVELFCEGNPLGLTKYMTASWKQKFERYVRRNIIRTAFDAAIDELHEEKALPTICTDQNEVSIMSKVLGKVFERLPDFKGGVRHSSGFHQVANDLTKAAHNMFREELQKKLQSEYPGHFNNVILDTEQPYRQPKPPSCSLL